MESINDENISPDDETSNKSLTTISQGSQSTKIQTDTDRISLNQEIPWKETSIQDNKIIKTPSQQLQNEGTFDYQEKPGNSHKRSIKNETHVNIGSGMERIPREIDPRNTDADASKKLASSHEKGYNEKLTEGGSYKIKITRKSNANSHCDALKIKDNEEYKDPEPRGVDNSNTIRNSYQLPVQGESRSVSNMGESFMTNDDYLKQQGKKKNKSWLWELVYDG